MRAFYRIVYKNGTHGAWSKDYEYIKKNAKFFGGKIEMKIFRSI